jgi:benzil reductase ((S)-benzoin forming)
MRAIGRVLVWISGASAGIGAALAATIPFDAEVVDISRRGGRPGIHHVAADLADPSSWPMVAQDFERRLARFDGDAVVFIHNAANLTPLGPAGVVDTADYTRNVLLNSAAGQVLGQAFLQATSGLDCEQHLIVVSSGAAGNPYEGESSYCAGKAALNQWVRVVGQEQARRQPGCRVIAIAPGAVDTAMQDELRSTEPSLLPQAPRFQAMAEHGALLSPDVVAKVIWSLLDRDLDNGSVLHIRDLA